MGHEDLLSLRFEERSGLLYRKMSRGSIFWQPHGGPEGPLSRAPFQVGWRWATAGSSGNRVFLCNSEHVSERAVISDKRVLFLFLFF